MNISAIATGAAAGELQTNESLKASAPSARQAKLADAAQKFEAMMLTELLKPMQKAGSVSGAGFDGDADDNENDPDRDASLDNLSSYGVEAMAEALAKGGGIGLAKQVMRQIGKEDEGGRKKSSSTKV